MVFLLTILPLHLHSRIALHFIDSLTVSLFLKNPEYLTLSSHLLLPLALLNSYPLPHQFILTHLLILQAHPLSFLQYLLHHFKHPHLILLGCFTLLNFIISTSLSHVSIIQALLLLFVSSMNSLQTILKVLCIAFCNKSYFQRVVCSHLYTSSIVSLMRYFAQFELITTLIFLQIALKFT